MLSRFVASCLVVLITAPFTAPFSTCDFESLFGSGDGLHKSLFADRNAHHSPIVPSRSAKTLSNDAAIPSAPVASTAGRSRLMPVFHACDAVGRRYTPGVARPRTTASERGTSCGSGLTTVLRL